MAINLEKGQRQAIDAPKFTVGLGWDDNKSNTGEEFDLDASVFLVGENGKISNDKNLVYYNNLSSLDGSVNHSGDNLSGAGEGDDETISVDLSKLSSDITEICFVATIHQAEQRKQNFGQVRNSFIRIFDQSNTELVKYELDEDFSIETAVEFGRLYKRNNEWKFEAVGMGMKGGLQDYLNKYN